MVTYHMSVTQHYITSALHQLCCEACDSITSHDWNLKLLASTAVIYRDWLNSYTEKTYATVNVSLHTKEMYMYSGLLMNTHMQSLLGNTEKCFKENV